MMMATRQVPPAQKYAGGQFARLDEEYLIEVRPYLTDGEARVYELIVLKCDRWKAPINPTTIAALARIHVDTVRRTMRRLEAIGLIRSHWSGAPKSPTTARTIEIVREYERVRDTVQRSEFANGHRPPDGIERSHPTLYPDQIQIFPPYPPTRRKRRWCTACRQSTEGRRGLVPL